MKFARLLPLIALAASVAAYAQNESANLTRKAKAGEVVTYNMSATMTMSLGSGNFTATMTRTVKKADEKGYTVEEKMDGKAEFGGQEFPVQSTETQVYNDKEQLVDVTGDDIDDSKKQITFRMNALQDFHGPEKPVKVGDTWTFKAEPNSGNGNVGAQVDYKVESAEEVNGHKTFKVHATAKQTGDGKSTGTLDFWIDRTSGQMVKMTGDMKQVEVAGAPMPFDMTFTLTLKE